MRLTGAQDAALNVIVGARNLDDLRISQALDPNLRTLVFVEGVDDIERFVEAGIDIIRLWPEWIDRDPRLVKKVHAFEKPVWVTAGAAPRAELERLITLGINGILSDHPAVVSAVRADLATRRGK